MTTPVWIIKVERSRALGKRSGLQLNKAGSNPALSTTLTNAESAIQSFGYGYTDGLTRIRDSGFRRYS